MRGGKDVRPGAPGTAMGSGRAQSGLGKARAAIGLPDGGAGGRGENTFGSGPAIFKGTRPTPDRIEWCARCGTPASMCLGHYAPNPLKQTMSEKRDTQSTTGSGIDLSGLRSYRGKPGDE